MSKAILLGPYVGSFTQEILVFRPHIRYISQTIDDAELYVSSHLNRSFLYDWIKPDNFIPIYEHISRDEPNQNGFTFDDITKTEFNQITKKIRGAIPHDDVDIHTLPYVKNTNSISFYQKIYTPFDIPEFEIDDNLDVVCIFDKSDDARDIYKRLRDIYDITVIGDMNNGLEDVNVLMSKPIFETTYLRMFNYIKKCRLVVTNCIDWALICNCQGIPVFYWGHHSSLFKTNGVLNFNNNKCTSVCDMSPRSIAGMVRYCYEEKLYKD